MFKIINYKPINFLKFLFLLFFIHFFVPIICVEITAWEDHCDSFLDLGYMSLTLNLILLNKLFNNKLPILLNHTIKSHTTLFGGFAHVCQDDVDARVGGTVSLLLVLIFVPNQVLCKC